MENQEQMAPRQSISKRMMSAGLGVGILLSVSFILSTQGGGFVQAIMYIINIAAIVAAWFYAKNYRDRDCEGHISWGQAFGFIVGMYFFASLIGAITRLVYLQWINTEYLSQMLDQVMSILDEASADLPDDIFGLMQKLLTPINIAIYSIFGECFSGVIIGAIMAIFLRKQETI